MSQYILGIDVGGTKIQAGLVNSKNKTITNQQFLLNGKNKKAALDSIIKSIQSLNTKEVKAIGIGITGLVNHQNGVVVQSPNLPPNWYRVPLRKIIEQKFKRPVAIDNDANCIALAEALIGAGINYSHVLSLTLGTGVGLGLVNNKQIYHGAMGALEFGHTIVAEDSPACSCKRIGHLEALISGHAMAKLYTKLTGRLITPQQVEQESKTGKKIARRVFKTMSHWLAVGLANAIHSYNPDIIVLGGGLSRVKTLTNPAIRAVPKMLIFPELNKTKITVSRLGYKAGVIGAALLAKFNKKY